MSQQNQQTTDRTRTSQKQLWLLVFAMLMIISFMVACTMSEVEPVADCTNICVDAHFESFYRENGLAELFGDPYSGVVLVQPYTTDGDTAVVEDRQAQYFNGGRLELNPETGNVEITRLGEWAFAGLNEPNIAPDLPEGESNCFANNLCVQGAFLDFYMANNGEVLFGAPISPQLNEGDLRVQYFENVRLEWHPEAPTGQQVQVGLIGRAHYLYTVYDPNIIVALPIDDIELDEVEVTAAVNAPIMYTGDEQVIYVLVETADHVTKVEGVTIRLTIAHNNKTSLQEIAEKTSGTGTAQAIIDLPNFTPGEEVEIKVFAYNQSGEEIGSTIITFQTWW